MNLLTNDLTDLVRFNHDTLEVYSREAKRREFKLQFSEQDFSRYTRVLAAFSNTDGGVLVFGIGEKPRRIVGVDLETIPDESLWTDRLRKDFDPEVAFEIKEYRIGSRVVVAIGVEKNTQRPVICRRDSTVRVTKSNRIVDETVIQQGAVYFRQSGQTRPIAYTELKSILEERDEQRLRAFLENVEIIQKIGPNRVGVVDVFDAVDQNETTNLYISRETARTLNLIDRGRFVESEDLGAPAYYIAGNVQLNEAIVTILAEADKNLPSEAAEIIKPVVRELFGPDVPFTAQHLARLARYSGIRDGTQTDQRYCVFESKINRVFYTRDGIDFIVSKLKSDPDKGLRAFAAKKHISTIENDQ